MRALVTANIPNIQQQDPPPNDPKEVVDGLRDQNAENVEERDGDVDKRDPPAKDTDTEKVDPPVDVQDQNPV